MACRSAALLLPVASWSSTIGTMPSAATRAMTASSSATSIAPAGSDQCTRHSMRTVLKRSAAMSSSAS
jgi:hypothetical protein